MFGGIATWDREKNCFQIHKSGFNIFSTLYISCRQHCKCNVYLHLPGVTSEGNLKHVEVECLESIDDLIKKNMVPFDNLFYLYLNKAPCADYNGNRKNCLDKVIKWATANPSRKLILGFRKPYAIGSFTERGSWHRPDKEIWPLYKMNLMCRKLPQN